MDANKERKVGTNVERTRSDSKTKSSFNMTIFFIRLYCYIFLRDIYSILLISDYYSCITGNTNTFLHKLSCVVIYNID